MVRKRLAALLAAASMMFTGAVVTQSASAATGDGGASVSGGAAASAPAGQPGSAAPDGNGTVPNGPMLRSAEPAPAVSVSNVRVSDVGAHTAQVSFDYRIASPLHEPGIGLPNAPIKVVTPILSVQRINSVTVKDNKIHPYEFQSPWSPDITTGTADTDLTADTYSKIYGVKTFNSGVYGAKASGGAGVGGYFDNAMTLTGQDFYRYSSTDWKDNGSKLSGTFTETLIGLQPGTRYGTFGDSSYPLGQPNSPSWAGATAYNVYADLLKKNMSTSKVDLSKVFAGLIVSTGNTDHDNQIIYGGGVPTLAFSANAQPVPSFTTLSEPSTSGSAPDVGGITPPNNGSVAPGSVSRMYVNGLQAACKAKVDAGQGCFWYSYIYSNPVKLLGPNGTPYVKIQKDASGKYYFDVIVPKNYTGAHTISLQDASGKVQASAQVQVGVPPAPKPKPSLGTPVAVYRVYNKHSGLHHYTTNLGEKNALVKLGWKYEGVSFNAAKQGSASGLVPVYREYNPHDGNHNWTLNQAEHSKLVSLGWHDEGVAWYANPAGPVTVYRLYNPHSGEHVYTTSAKEYAAVGKAGWHQEGTAWKGL